MGRKRQSTALLPSAETKATTRKSTTQKSTTQKSIARKSTTRRSRSESTAGAKRKKEKLLSIDTFISKERAAHSLSCGNGDMGQLGHGENVVTSRRPRLVTSFPDGTKFLQAVAGGMHSVVLTSNFEVFTCGNNDEGALGRPCVQEDDDDEDNSKDEDFVFRIVSFPSNAANVVMISAGDSHTAALTRNGSVFIWGTFRDKGGVLGLALDSEKAGRVLKNTKSPFLLSSAKDRIVVKICSGSHHVVMLTDNGKIFTVGAGDAGQLGRLSPHSRDSAVSHRTIAKMMVPAEVVIKKTVQFEDVWCASHCSFARSIDGNIFAWGLNNYSQLGIKANDDVQDVHYPSLSEAFVATRVWKGFAGDHHILAIDERGACFGIGRGDDCKLGQGSDNVADSAALVQISDHGVAGVAAATGSSFYWDDQGRAFAWGFNNEAELGLGLEDSEVVEKPREIAAPRAMENCRFVQISANAQHTVFLATQDGLGRGRNG